MSNILVRTIAGAFFVIAILGTIIWGPIPFAILFFVFSQIALYEYFRMANGNISYGNSVFGMISGAIVYFLIAMISLGYIDVSYLLSGIILFIVSFIIGLFRHQGNAIKGINTSIVGVMYVVVPMALLNFFFNVNNFTLESSPMFLIGFFVIQWVYDIFAYLFGKYFGKYKLFERISPKKTWEGFIGGTIVAILVSFGVNYFLLDLGWIHWLVIALIIIVFGTLGDLSVSMIKRHYQVKDSGKIIPGHGGVLDRFDSILFSAPLVFLYFYLAL